MKPAPALVHRYVSAIVPLKSLLVLHAYGPWTLSENLINCPNNKHKAALDLAGSGSFSL